MEPLLTEKDIRQIRARGLSAEAVLSQLRIFSEGFPFIELIRPCRPGDGIDSIQSEEASLLSFYEQARAKGRCSVFVPASGAASRMFKALAAVYHRDKHRPDRKMEQLRGSQDPEDRDALEFLENLAAFAFYEELRERMESRGESAEACLKEGRYVSVLKYVLTSAGLDYETLPKGLIPFHRYGRETRTPFEEHLTEAAMYAADAGGTARLHFTVLKEFEARIRRLLAEKKSRFEKNNVTFEIGFSYQKASTDTVAADLQNSPFRDARGELVFRPAGHGALLENMNDLKGDIVFIKNIDNVLPDGQKGLVVHTQKLLGGFLLKKQKQVFSYLERIEAGTADEKFLDEAVSFCTGELGLDVPSYLSGEQKKEWVWNRLNRPIRVCGMVKNEGEPGGGPFWVRASSGEISRQIVEKSQVDPNRAGQRQILDSATHFNPVNLVCGLRDFKGMPFDLSRYVDPATGFISVKSKDGKTLKALELPGLWNGAMARWMTFFAEVPIETFGPVKTVNDLLREKHHAEEKVCDE